MLALIALLTILIVVAAFFPISVAPQQNITTIIINPPTTITNGTTTSTSTTTTLTIPSSLFPQPTTAENFTPPTILQDKQSSNTHTGYMLERSSFNGIAATWTIPYASNNVSAASSQWIGIQAFSPPLYYPNGLEVSPIVQIGTESDGSGQYYLWYEVNSNPPSYDTELAFASPGDQIHASITRAVNSIVWNINFSDLRNGRSFDFNVTNPVLTQPPFAAEWMVERPTPELNSIPKLALSNSTSFHNLSVTIDGAATNFCNMGSVWELAMNGTNESITSCNSFLVAVSPT